MDDKRIRIIDNDLIICEKLPGEDSERLLLPEPYAGFGVLSRLDRPVGGLIPLIRKGADASHYSIEKAYLAVVSGDPGPSGDMTDLLFHDGRNNKTFVVKRMRSGVREASLHYERQAYDEQRDLALVRIVLHTGRTHQIRVQFASRHHPLAGDRKYGSRTDLPFVALMAYEITVTDKKAGDPVTVRIDPPRAFPWELFY